MFPIVCVLDLFFVFPTTCTIAALAAARQCRRCRCLDLNRRGVVVVVGGEESSVTALPWRTSRYYYYYYYYLWSQVYVCMDVTLPSSSIPSYVTTASVGCAVSVRFLFQPLQPNDICASWRLEGGYFSLSLSLSQHASHRSSSVGDVSTLGGWRMCTRRQWSWCW